MDNVKFQATQRVRVRDAGEMENPGRPMPDEHVMGMTGIVEATGLVYESGVGNEKYLLPAYFIRVEGIGSPLS